MKSLAMQKLQAPKAAALYFALWAVALCLMFGVFLDLGSWILDLRPPLPTEN